MIMNGSSAATVTLISAPATIAAAAHASRAGRHAGRHHQRDGDHHREDHQQVVVGPAEAVDREQRVGADHQQGPHGVESAHAGAAPQQRQRPRAGQQRLELHPPQRSGHPERGERVGEQRVQRSVGGRHVLPVLAHVVVDGVAHDRRGTVQVGVDAVLDPHAGVGDVAEHVGRQQDRAHEDDQLQRPDERDRPARPQPGGVGPAGEREQAGVGADARPAGRSGRRGSRAARRCPTASPRSGASGGSARSARRPRRARSPRWRRAAPARGPRRGPVPSAPSGSAAAPFRPVRRRSRGAAAHNAVHTVLVSR